MLRVELFGSGQASYANHLLAGFPNQQFGLLLCYLLLHKPYPHNREHLASIFWGNCPTRHARKHLCNNLWRLRQAFLSIGADPDEYFQIHEDNVSFRTTSRYWLDVDVFEDAITNYLSMPDENVDRFIMSVEEAIKLYTGDLLEGVYEDWCLFERERLRLLYINALNKLMVSFGLKQNPLNGLEYGRRILNLDPTQENVHYRMMVLYWMAGDRNAAMQQYKSCVQILREELNVQPMSETKQLYEKILVGKDKPIDLIREKNIQFIDGSAINQLDESLIALHVKLLREKLAETQAELMQIENLISSLTKSSLLDEA